MTTFIEIIDNLNFHLDKLLNELKSSPLIELKDVENINGIYVFYENDEALYVGRTNNNRMRERIKEHYKRYSNKNSATFAFLIARQNKMNSTLSTIETNEEDFFIRAKERVSKMKIKFIKVDDPIIQTILEPYIAFKLKTTETYNSFKTH